MEELKTIEANYPTLQRRRIEMLEEWQKKVTPTWSAVVQALMGIGMGRLASQLAQKQGLLSIGSIHIFCIKVLRLNLVIFLCPHSGVSLTQPPDDEALEHLANTSLQEEVVI